MSQTIVIVSTVDFSAQIIPILRCLAAEWRISDNDFENLYDWIVSEGLSRYLNLAVKGRVKGHFSHDVYRCIYTDIYDRIGEQVDELIHHLVTSNRLNFLYGQNVKIVCTYREIIIVKTDNHF